MTAKNEITGDLIKTKETTKQYEDNYDRIFRKQTDVTPSSDSGCSPDPQRNTPLVGGMGFRRLDGRWVEK